MGAFETDTRKLSCSTIDPVKADRTPEGHRGLGRFLGRGVRHFRSIDQTGHTWGERHMKKPARRNQTRRGFTLVELVVVVLVLGIIASVAAPKMFDTASDARQNATIQSLAVIRDSIELYRAQNGAYPGDAGTEADFKNDMDTFLKGVFPTNQISGATNNATVAVSSAGTALSASGTQGWKYDKTSGEFIINTTGYDTL